MAKKKACEVEQYTSSIDDTLALLEKTYGNFVRSNEDIENVKRMVIPLSPNLDAGLGGGIPEGTWVSIVSDPKFGKSTTALSFAAECQKPEYGSRPIFYFNVEGRLKERDWLGIKGLKFTQPEFTIIESKKGKIYSGKDFLNIAQQLISDVPGCVIIFDSISAFCTSKILEEGIGASDFGAGNKLIAQFCDINSSVVPINNCIVIGIVHFYANTSGYGKAKAMKAASRWKYQSDVIIEGKNTEAWEESGSQIGQKLNWIINTSAIGPPGGKVTSYLRYGTGIDKSYESMLVAQDLGLITGKGWYTLDFLASHPDAIVGTELAKKEELKLQGNEKVYKFINENPKVYDALQIEMKKMVGGE